MKRISKKIMKSRVLIIAVAFSVFLSFTSFAADSVNSGEPANIKGTVIEIAELEDNLNKNTNTLVGEERIELITNVDEEESNTLENANSSPDEETVMGESIIVDEEGNVVEEEVAQPNVDGEAVAFSSAMLSNYGKTVPIYNANDLATFLGGGLGNNDDEFILMNDIVMDGSITYRGRGGDVPFTGRFASEEGSQYTISNLSLMGRNVAAETLGGNDIGFIRTAGAGAVIENVNFDKISYVEPPSDPWSWGVAHSHIGLVVGRVTGGAVNINNINVTNSTMTLGSTAVYQYNSRVGGFIGSIEENATATIGEVLIDATIQMFRGDITLTYMNRGGGLVGESAGDLTITNSEVNANITRNGATGNFWHAGGVLGRRTAGDVFIEDVTQKGNVVANIQAGGIVGDSSGGGSLTLDKVSTSPETTITVNNGGRIGGLIASTAGKTTISNSENHSLLSLPLTGIIDSEVGGLVGFAGGGLKITDSSNYGNLDQSGVINNARMAGIVARTENNVTLTNVENQGNITRTINSEVGDGFESPNGHNNRVSSGILGVADVASGEEVRIDNAVNHGNMPSRIKLVAGIAGRLVGEGKVYITNSANHGDLETHERAGGIVGRNELLNLEIDRCINYGKISAENGHAGQNMIGGIISSSQTGTDGEGAARIRNVTIRNCANRGEVVSKATGVIWNGTGGIAGWVPNEGLVIENTYNIGHVRSTAVNPLYNTNVGGIIGLLQWPNVNIILRNVYSIGPVTSMGSNSTNGNGILGHHWPGTTDGTGALRLENVYVSAYFTGNAISDLPVRVKSTNAYVDRSTAPTTDTDRLQTEEPGITAVTTEQLVSGSLSGLQGGSWMQGIAGMPGQRTLPYFAWQTGGEQQEPFFNEIYSTNEESVTEGANISLSGITGFPLINEVDIDVQYSTEGFDYSKVRVFTPNNEGLPYSYLGNEIEVRSIKGSAANIPSRSLTTGLISKNDVVGFDWRAGHRIYFDLQGGEISNDAPLAQIIPHGELAYVPEVEREGYIFEGWSTEPDGGGKQYSPEANIAVESGGTFYAKWTAATTTLTVAKEVTGEMGNLKQEFIFTIYFQDSEENSLADTEINYEGDTVGKYNNQAPNGGKLTLDNNGCATFKLAAGQAIRFVDVPAIGCVRVVETPDEIYETSICDSENKEDIIDGKDTTMLLMAKDRTFTFTNEREYVPPTGIGIDSTAPVLMGVVSTAALAEFVFYIVNRYHRNASSTK